ncbi:MAG TPA: cytochrome P460 family protein [Chitinophagaceae bacterium]|nr:cytochrome P460 family protein [Chitinophagaceae bacterium]
MKKFFIVLIIIFLTGTAFISGTAYKKKIMIPYPEGFRKWVHIKTSLTGFNNVPQKKFDGFHLVYANEKAMRGYHTGHFPDGSIIVFDKHNVDTANGAIKPGSRKFINIMYKDSAAFKDTGGWGFEEFTGDSRTEGRLTLQRQQACFNSCHAGQNNTGFVFSKYEE